MRTGEWPAWFSFWFSGRWRALAKGTAWAGFYWEILLLLPWSFEVRLEPHEAKVEFNGSKWPTWTLGFLSLSVTLPAWLVGKAGWLEVYTARKRAR